MDVIASARPRALAERLKALGAQQVSIRGRIISARVPLAALHTLESDSDLKFARPVLALTRRGAAVSQGDHALKASAVRPPSLPSGPTGSGVSVGVLSDSFDCLGGAATDIANDEFSPVIVLQEEIGCAIGSDEGRAMIQIVADVAPGSTQLFHSAFNGEAAFANGIEALEAAGARVIVDDVLYLTEPFFHDGVIAQAIDRVVSRGAAYFSAAGNNGRESYQADFRAVTGAPPISDTSATVGHDFNPGAGVDFGQDVRIPAGASLSLAFQWDDPFLSSSELSSGASTDLDVYLLDANNNRVASSEEFSIGGDALEIIDYVNETAQAKTLFLHIRLFDGPIPGRIKHVNFGDENVVFQYPTDSATLVGHPVATGAFAVGAAAFFETPACGVSPALLEPYSSGGGVEIFRRPDGTPFAEPVLRQKPDAVGPDGANTSFFGDDDFSFSAIPACSDDDAFGNFFGTSAAAPHIAGVAALLLEVVPNATPARLYKALRDSALDMGDAGVDLDTGHGFIQADRALNRLSPPRVTLSRVSQGVAEGRPAVVDLVLERPPTERVVAFLGVSGTATAGADYDTLPSRVVFRAGGSSRRRVTVRSIDDAIAESNETVIIDVTKVNGGRRGNVVPFTATIRNND